MMKSGNLKQQIKMSFRQLGQSMIEYTVVVGLGVMALTATMSSGGSEQTSNFPDTYSAKDALWQRMQDHYTGYSYAISLSDTPDHNNLFELNKLYNDQGIPDDLRDYLIDYEDSFIGALLNLQNNGFPSMQDGLDMITDAVGLL